MSVQAYITAGQNVIPVLMPDDKMRDTARQIGLPEVDLFRVDVPASMSRHLSASVLLSSTQMANLYGSETVSLTLEDSSGFSITMSGLYARPPQPFYWTEQGGVAMVELVDDRWYWRFTTSGLLDRLLTVAYFSDGRWQDNGVDSTTPPPDPPDKITTFEELWDRIEAEIAAVNLTMPTEPTWPNWTDAERAANLRRLSDFVGTQTVSLSMLIDVIGMVIGAVLRYTGSGYSYLPRIGLKGSYDNSMDSYRVAMRGGMQPTNGVVTSSDVLVTQWQSTGYQARAPLKASAVFPYHAVEARTYYNNCARNRVPTGGMSFLASAIYTNPAVHCSPGRQTTSASHGFRNLPLSRAEMSDSHCRQLRDGNSMTSMSSSSMRIGTTTSPSGERYGPGGFRFPPSGRSATCRIGWQ